MIYIIKKNNKKIKQYLVNKSDTRNTLLFYKKIEYFTDYLFLLYRLRFNLSKHRSF